MWYVPIGWWDRLQCHLGDCNYKGTCIQCDGWPEIKKQFEKWKRNNK
jgi:hypothetical protein